MDGRITVIGRPGVEKRTCKCYLVVKNEYDQLLPHQQASQHRSITGHGSAGTSVEFKPARDFLMAIIIDPKVNHLLAAMPDTEWQR